MAALFSAQRATLQRLVTAGLLLAVVVLLGVGYEYHRYARRVDRLLIHSSAFAARPRVQLMRLPARHHAGLIPASLSGHTGRHVPAYDALPPELVAAVVSVEDRRFFDHSGVDYLRTTRCAVQDALSFHMACGGSTLTQQLARADFLSQRKTLHRKLEEIVIARALEHRLTKQQIFAMYAMEVNLGQHGPNPIKGFAQASQVYFGQDLHSLTLAQDALLAGIIQAPNFDNPFRHPERATRRRNIVLDTMVETGAITRPTADAAKAEPLQLADRLSSESVDQNRWDDLNQ